MNDPMSSALVGFKERVLPSFGNCWPPNPNLPKIHSEEATDHTASCTNPILSWKTGPDHIA
jgi:hypothetical protein